MDSVSVTIARTEDGYTNSVTVQLPVSANDAATCVLGEAITRAIIAAWCGSLTNADNILAAAGRTLAEWQ